MIFNACVQFICQIPAAPLMTLVNVNSYLRLNPEAIIRKEFEQMGFNGRFGPGLPRVSDGSLLFLLHLISKMRPTKDGGNSYCTSGPTIAEPAGWPGYSPRSPAWPGPRRIE